MIKPRKLLLIFGLMLLTAQAVPAEVVKVDITRRDDAGTHERIIGRVHFAVDPKLPANRGIADLDLAPKNSQGKVEFAGDLLMFVPKDASRARGTAFLEVVNRGRDQSLAIMSAASQRNLSPENWVLGDRFLLKQGFTVAFIGWQFDVQPAQGLTFDAPVAPVEGIVRQDYVSASPGRRITNFGLKYCAAAESQKDAAVSFRTRMDETPQPLPRDSWNFSAGGCSVHINEGLDFGLYEAVYRAEGSPVAGLGLAAIRDFASWLHGEGGVRNVIGYGYSQSARFLREFVRDGFNADEHGHAAFDGLMIASAGAGGGSFNHRFASPGEAGNSVLSILRPVDLPPFTDDLLLARARAAQVAPKIFYTFSSTEYWARAGSLTHTTEDGTKDAALAATSRLYFLAGTPHATGPLPPDNGRKSPQFEHFPNFADQRWTQRALLLDLDEWVRKGTEPPASQYPRIAKGELVPLSGVKFPAAPSFPFATYMPKVWHMDLGAEYSTSRVIANQPPKLGVPYPVLVPQVNADGNDVSGIRLPEVAVPLGTYTGWNITRPRLQDLGYLAGLIGGFEPFALTRADRQKAGDVRLSVEERYTGRQDYLDRVKKAAATLVRERFMLADDVGGVLQRAEDTWDIIVGSQSR
jgi:hypothetical protein